MDQAFDVAQVTALGRVAERQRDPAGAGPCRPPDAVDIAFRLVGKLEVDDMADAVDVDAAGRDIGRHQDPRVTGAEALEGALAGRLGLVAMDRLGGDAAFDELVGDAVGAVLGAREHEHPRHRGIVQQAGQQGHLAAGVDVVDALLEALDRRRLGRHLDAHRVGQDLAREARDFARHGGREQQRLALLWQGRGDLADVAHEAHVEHPVGLVEDEELDRIEHQLPLVHQIEQAAGRGDQDVDAARERVDLWLLADAAHDHGLAQMQILAVGAELVVDLNREFAGRREDQGARTAPPACAALLGKLVEDGQREGRRARSSGMARAWIGVGTTWFLLINARWIGSAKPSSENLLMVT